MSNKLIIFVGDRPSKFNLDQNIPFIGTKSYKNLLNWIEFMALADEYQIFNSHNQESLNKINLIYKNYECKIISLGRNAEKRLNGLNIKNFYLPHPSGLNRLLNNKDYVENILIKCKNYITNEV